jgi:membrane glycosyltransferase
LLERSTRDLAHYTTANPSFAGRRVLFAVLVVASMAVMLWLMAMALSPGGFDLVDVVILVLFGLILPWVVIGFWNSTIGFLIMRFARDPVAAVLPLAARIRGDEPITAATAILMCIRNEAPQRVVRNLELLMSELVSAGVADRFHVYVLSDTNMADVATQEENQFGALKARWRDRIALTYRRRDINTGFKAGNVRDFCDRWGDLHELAITLDTDSLMSGAAALRLVRIMQAEPKLGILQGLVIGLPSTSAFARLFQFGMRLSMRSFTLGSAWWQGDCGPYWGHNAVLRLAPFIAHCKLPVLPEDARFGGHVLSHDQIEATLMRSCGYEVRALPEEDLGWEENPPTLIEFVRRDLRWCQGNMQYWHFLAWPGLKLVSRYQLAFAILMFVSSPAWIGLLVVGVLMAAVTANPADVIRTDVGNAVFALVLVMWFWPKVTTAIDILLRPNLLRAFGGIPTFVESIAAEAVFSVLLAPIMWFGHTMFITGLLFGRTIGWIGQVRDDHSVPVSVAVRNFWPHSAFGIAMLGLLALTQPSAIPYAFFIAGGLALSIPLAVITSKPKLGQAFTRVGIGRLPEETEPPVILKTLAVPAVVVAASKPRAA